MLAAFVAVLGALSAAFPSGAWATNWWVSPSGSDTSLGTSQFPFRTISRAAAVARDGDTVNVAPGRYAEMIELDSRHSGVVFQATGGEGRPLIDGARRRPYGFRNSGANRLAIRGFEIAGQTDAGVYTESGSQNEITGNLIHHIGSSSESENVGVRVLRGAGNRVTGNTVHHIGPGRASVGIWLLETRNALVEGNGVYLARKEGVRDWKGLDNTISRNRVLLTWVGIALNTSTGSVVTDNHLHDNVEGFSVKHASYRSVLDYWDLDEAHWSRLEHNTVERSSEAAIWIAQSDEPLDYVDVRGNHFAGAGAAFLRDIPSLRGPHVTVDQNAYSDAGWAPRWLYNANWDSDDGLTEWSEVRRETGWEMTAPPPDAGAWSTLPAPASWTPFAMTPVDSSSKGTYSTQNYLDAASDDDQSTYWMTEGSRNEYVVFDFGQPQTFNHLLLTLYSHDDRRNPRGYRFSVSDDRASWRTILSGVNEDASGAARYYELPEPVTARYLRFTMLDTFCATYRPRLGCGKNFVLSDLKAGFVTAQEPSQEPSGEPVSADVEPLLGLLPRATLTRKGALRIRVACDESAGGTVRFVVGNAGRRRVALEPGCNRAVKIPLRQRLVKRLRRGTVRRVRVVASAPGGERVKKRVRVRA